MIRSTVRYDKYMHYHLYPTIPRETKSNVLFRILWRSIIKVIDHYLHVLILLVVPHAAAYISVIGLVLSGHRCVALFVHSGLLL